MTNNELTLDQLHAISGGLDKPSYKLKELSESGDLFQKVKYIPGEMYRFLPGDML